MTETLQELREKVDLHRELAGAEAELENRLSAQREIDRRAEAAQAVQTAQADLAVLQEQYEDGLAESNQAFTELVAQFEEWVATRADIARAVDAMLSAAFSIVAGDVYSQPGIDRQSQPSLVRECHQGLARGFLMDAGIVPAMIYKGAPTPTAINLMRVANSTGTLIDVPPIDPSMI